MPSASSAAVSAAEIEMLNEALKSILSLILNHFEIFFDSETCASAETSTVAPSRTSPSRSGRIDESMAPANEQRK